MTHFRTHIYEATKAMLLGRTAAMNRIYVERVEPFVARETYPCVVLGFGASRVTSDDMTGPSKGSVDLSVEVVATGDNGDLAAKTRDACVEEVKSKLLSSTSVWARWLGDDSDLHPTPLWKVTQRVETPRRGRAEGAELVSSTTIELTLEIEDVIVDDAELWPFDQINVTAKTQEPDDDTVEMQFTITPGSTP